METVAKPANGEAHPSPKSLWTWLQQTTSRVAGTGEGSSARLTGVLVACCLVILGAFALVPLWLHMAEIWQGDPLRVIGAAFPLISFVGVLGAWRRQHWTLNGSFWGLVPIALSIYLSRLVSIAPYIPLYRMQYWLAVHAGPVLFLYGVGAVLLFGGWRLSRAAILPLCLLLCINPVPHSFNVLFDMPLQQLSAATARGFAHLIGLHPTGVQLRMMFSPDFGMMIVPGCNGVRGSVTFAYLALIYGYTRRLRLPVLFGLAAAGLLFGYAMNLLRLCVLVIYYRLGLSFPGIQNYGAGVDYAIGCTIFLLGTIGLGFLARSMAPRSMPVMQPEALSSPDGSLLFVRSLIFLVLAAVPIFQAPRLLAAEWNRPRSEAYWMATLPKSVGAYTLVRTFTEQQYSTGGPGIVFGEYEGPAAADGQRSRIALGLYVGMGYHRLVDSKISQGLHPLRTGSLEASLPNSGKAFWGTSLYDDGEENQWNAEAVCSETTCSNPLVDYEHFRASDYTEVDAGKQMPILLRETRPDSGPTPLPEWSARFESDVRAFVGALDVSALVALDGTRVN